MSGLLAGKRLLVTGVITDASIAFSVAKLAQEQGAHGRAHRLRPAVAGGADRQAAARAGAGDRAGRDQPRAARRRWPTGSASTSTASTAWCTRSASRRRAASAAAFLDAPWEDVATAVHVSTYSYKSLAMAALPLMSAGGAVVGLTFDATKAWPVYDWMGVAKAGPGVGVPLPRAAPGPAGHPRQPGVGRPAADDGGQVDPRLRAVRGAPGPSGRRSAGSLTDQEPAARACLRAAVGLVPGHHRRDRPRRRRLPRPRAPEVHGAPDRRAQGAARAAAPGVGARGKMTAMAYDAFLLVSFGGPERPDDVMPFLRNVTRGRGVPDERLAEVAEHYQHFGGVSPINEQCRDLLGRDRRRASATHGVDLPLYWGNRNWHADARRHGGADARRRRHAAPWRSSPARTASYSSCRQYLRRHRRRPGPRSARTRR